MARLSKLVAVDEPFEPATDEAWDRLERMLRTKFPSSHRRLLKRFGTGVFGGRLLYLNPAAEQDWRSEYSARWAHGVASMLGGAFPELDFNLTDDGLLPFAMTGESVYLCFDRTDPMPSHWTVRICSLPDKWTKPTSLTSAALLCDLAGEESVLPKAASMRLWRPGQPVFEASSYLIHH